MKRKETAQENHQLSIHEVQEIGGKGVAGESESKREVFLMEDGKLRPFSLEEYTTAILYEVVDSFSVECRLVRPEDPGNLLFEGKKPSRKTVPIFIKKSGDCVLLDSWETIESSPGQLADVKEVIGAIPIRQAFVLKRK